jgi:transcriptional regulator with XRE-family HTH domain
MLDHFAEELRLARSTSGMSQTALAEAFAYSAALVAKVETCERRPSLDFARRCDTVFATGGRFERMQQRLSRETVVPWSVRDSKDPGGPALTFGSGAWRAFVTQVAARP